MLLIKEAKRPHNLLPMRPRESNTILLIQRPPLTTLRHERKGEHLITTIVSILHILVTVTREGR